MDVSQKGLYDIYGKQKMNSLNIIWGIRVSTKLHPEKKSVALMTCVPS
jgi:hypothetical protein